MLPNVSNFFRREVQPSLRNASFRDRQLSRNSCLHRSWAKVYTSRRTKCDRSLVASTVR